MLTAVRWAGTMRWPPQTSTDGALSAWPLPVPPALCSSQPEPRTSCTLPPPALASVLGPSLGANGWPGPNGPSHLLTTT